MTEEYGKYFNLISYEVWENEENYKAYYPCFFMDSVCDISGNDGLFFVFL